MDIVDGQVGDADEIARILVESWRNVYSGILTGGQLAGVTVEKQRARHVRMLTAGVAYVLAKEGDAVMGFASSGAPRLPLIQDDRELYTLYARHTHLGKGIGGILLAAVLARQPPGSVSIGVLTFTGNPCRGFYDKHGFVPAGSAETEVSGRMEPLVYYRRPLRL